MWLENSNTDDMFNKIDCSAPEWEACCKVAGAIDRHPQDYYQGLPEPVLVVPKNILLFSRQEAFDEGHGTEHHRFLLIFCLNGEGSVIVDDEVARLRPGCALLVTPHQFHHYARLAGTGLLWLFLSFELENLEELSGLRGRVFDMTPLQVTCLRELASRYAGLGRRREVCPEITMLACLLLEQFRRGSATGRSVSAGPLGMSLSRRLIQDVARYVHGHVAEAIHIPDVARAVALSESHLRSRFHAIAGIGLGAYIRRLRLHRARTLMLASDLRLKEIAERCGYDSIYTFSRAFRREMGMSPSNYRHQSGGKRRLL